MSDVPLVGLQSVNVAFPGLTHLLFGKFQCTYSKSLNFITADQSIVLVYGLALEHECK